MEKRCGVAIVGYGGMGSWHATLLREIPEADLKGIFDILPERIQAARDAGIFTYGSLDAVLQDKEVSLITIAIPNDIHKAIAIQAMEAGKNVVCEKPVALSSIELQEMIDAAKKNNVLFTVHQNRRWDEDFLIAKKLYDSNSLGKVFNIESRVHGSRGIPGDWRNTKEHGGGMVLDWGVHLIDQILMMLADRKLLSLYAKLSYVTNEAVDDGFTILLNYDNNLTCHIEVGTSNFISLPRWYIEGENGTAVIEDWNLNGKIVMVSDWEKRDAVPVVTAAGLTKTMAPRTSETIQEYPLPRVPSDIKEYYRNVIKAIIGKEEIIVKRHEVMNSMRVMEAVIQSAQKNQVVYFNEDI
jgi:predicted dehydrogenase